MLSVDNSLVHVGKELKISYCAVAVFILEFENQGGGGGGGGGAGEVYIEK